MQKPQKKHVKITLDEMKKILTDKQNRSHWVHRYTRIMATIHALIQTIWFLIEAWRYVHFSDVSVSQKMLIYHANLSKIMR